MIKKRKKNASKKLYTIGMFICIALIYLGFISQSYNYDGTVFSLSLRYSDAKGDLARVVHPHHILYQPLAHIFYKFLKLCSFEPITVFALQLMGIIFAISTLIIFYFIIKSIYQDNLLAFLTIPLLAFSYAYWFFSIEAEVYIISCFFLTITFWLMIKKTSSFTIESSLLLGLCFGLAVLAHISNIILLPLCLFFLIKSTSGAKAKTILAFSLNTIGIIGIPYLYILSVKEFPTFKATKLWLMGSAHPSWGQGSVTSWWNFELKNFLLSLKMMRDIFISDTNYLSSSMAKITFTILKIPLTLCLIGLFIFFFYRIKSFIKKYNHVLPYVILWVVLHFIFFSIWDAGNKEHWVTSLIPFTIILAMVFKYLLDSKFAHIFKIVIPIFISGIFCFNFFLSIHPQSKEENNINYQKALFIKEHTPPNSLIILLGFPQMGYNYGKIYIPYFAEREILVLDWETGFQEKEPLMRIEGKIAQRFRQNDNIFILSEALTNNPAMRAFLSSHKITSTQWEQLLAKYKVQQEAEFSQDFKIFQLLSP